MNYFGPQLVGGRYKCGYWKYEYTVLAITEFQVTCRQETAGAFPESIGKVWSHSTGWDKVYDKIISQPAVALCIKCGQPMWKGQPEYRQGQLIVTHITCPPRKLRAA